MRFLALLPIAGLAAAKPFWAGFDAEWAFDTAETVLDTAETVLRGDGDEPTIWQQLQGDEKYSKLVKVLKFEEEIIKDLDKKADGYGITFFAPNDEGFPHHQNKTDLFPTDAPDDWEDVMLVMNFIGAEIESASPLIAALEAELEAELKHKGGKGGKGGKDKKGHKRQRKILKKIAHAVLQYHILPKPHNELALAQNSTVATLLHPHDGSNGGLARRIHLQKQLVPPALKVNFYSEVKSSSDAANGKLHELSRPLLPPPSMFEGMFHASRHVSTYTSAIQRVGGRHYVDWGYDYDKSKPGKPVFSGTPLATAFTPTNDAWEALPPRLHFWLFSRYGAHALAQLLAYHYVPHSLVLTEVLHHEKSKHKKVMGVRDDDPSFHHEYEVHSGLGEKAKLKIVVDKTKVLPVEGATKVTLKVNDNEAKVVDIPASNGAWHMLDKVLCPPHEHKKPDDEELAAQEAMDGEWAGWETWLPKLAIDMEEVNWDE